MISNFQNWYNKTSYFFFVYLKKNKKDIFCLLYFNLLYDMVSVLVSLPTVLENICTCSAQALVCFYGILAVTA